MVEMTEDIRPPASTELPSRVSMANSGAVLHEKSNPDPRVKATEDLEDETAYPKGLQLVLLTIGVCLVMFMVCFLF